MHLSFTIRSDLGELDAMRTQLQTLEKTWQLAPKTVTEINLVLEEAVANIILHGKCGRQSPIYISLSRSGDELTITVIDEGPPFDPTICAAPDTTLPLQQRPQGGLGVHLIRRFCQRCSYIRKDNKNILTLKRDLSTECRCPPC